MNDSINRKKINVILNKKPSCEYVEKITSEELFYVQEHEEEEKSDVFNDSKASELVKSHSFEEAKMNIEKFAKKNPTDFDLEKVESYGGLFYLFNHKVTGSELNELTSQIQTHFISVGKTQKDLFKEFGQVYKALDSLDKDYIAGILLAIKGVESTNDELKEAQVDIKKTIELQELTIEELRKHKEKLDNLENLDELDEFCHKVSEIVEENKILASNIDVCSEEITQKGELIEKVGYAVESLQESLKEMDAVNKSQAEQLAGYQEKLEDINVERENEKKETKKRINLSYIVSGCSVGLCFLQILLQMVGLL